jgi:hypothetical protein
LSKGNDARVVISFSATKYSDGVLLRWNTGHEVDNLGFHIYREEGGERVRLTPEPVAGSALLVGSRTALTAGRHYNWWDFPSLSTQSSLGPQSSLLGTVRYWLEDIDLSGKRTMHGPVTPILSRDPLPQRVKPELLSELGMRLEERYHHYWRVRELREKLNDRYRSRSTTFKDRFARGSLTLEAKQNRLLASSPAGTLLKGRRPAPPSSRPKADLLVQQHLATRPAVKLLVREEGWYRVTQPELVAAELNPRVNPMIYSFIPGRSTSGASL